MQMQTVDIDKIYCKLVKARQLMDMCGSTLDICNAIPYLTDSISTWDAALYRALCTYPYLQTRRSLYSRLCVSRRADLWSAVIIRTNWLVIVPPWKRPPSTSWLVLCLECRHGDLSVVWSENDCRCCEGDEVGWPGSCDRGLPWYRLHIFNPRHTSRYAKAGYSVEPRSHVNLPSLSPWAAGTVWTTGCS